jgi:ABC-type multidrug transport system fused ATPase/permease subunit
VTSSSLTILNNITLSIPAGGYSIGIVGPSGCGKSTLLRVLLGLEKLLDESGSKIFIDGHDVTTSERTRCFSIIGQETDLFRGLTLTQNIRYGTSFNTADPTRAARALSNAAEDAQLGPVLSRLSGGWDASVGPRGRLLSGGERQRVCLARALYREDMGAGGILLMDEATSSLDAQTESLVTQAVLKRVSLGATAIIIAHRLSSVRACDLILVMKDGRIIEQGSHSQLVNIDRGWYAESWRLQSQSQEHELGTRRPQ